MTKAALVDKVAATLQLPKHQTETVVNLFLQCIPEALRTGDNVELRGFGSFRLRHRRARVARTPHTGTIAQVPAKTVPWFTVGKALRALVNQPAELRHDHDVGRPVPAAAAREARGQTAHIGH